MNIYLKTIGLSLFLLLLCPKKCFAAEPDIFAGCRAEWAEEENGIAKITLTQSDTSVTELLNRTTDYIFMIDGSRTTALNDSYLNQEQRAEEEPIVSHCPCMTEGHYYMVNGTKMLLITHTLGYEYDTGKLRTWSYSEKLWTDNARAHYNGAGKRILVRYANGCLDIFTIFKNETINSIKEIAKRQDGSRVAFIVYSGNKDSLYGVLDYTKDYEEAIKRIKEAGFVPGSFICPGIDRARLLYDTGGQGRTTKLLVMGDGQNADIQSALEKMKAFRALPETAVYTACMGVEACVMGDGCQAMFEMSGSREDRFWRIQTRPQSEMAEAFSAALEEKMPVPVSASAKKYSGKIPGQWEYYEDTAKGYKAECSAGTFSHTQNQVTWKIPENKKKKMRCSFYVKLKEGERYVSELKEYDVLKNPELSYVIKGGSRDGEKGILETDCNPLSWKPSKIEVTKVKLLSGISYKKEEDVLFVKGGSENQLGFTSYTKYATQTWKPEKNFLYGKSGVGSVRELLESSSVRSEDFSKLVSTYPVTLYSDGEMCEYYPSALIGQSGNQLFTKQFDETKKLTLICDAVPPEIHGTVPEIVREDRKLTFTVEDTGSGVKKNSFSLEVLNLKTGDKKIFASSGKIISWNIQLEEPFYSGNLEWTLRAEDNVGNSTVLYGASNIRAPKGEEEISDEIRTRILLPRSDFSVDGIY